MAKKPLFKVHDAKLWSLNKKLSDLVYRDGMPLGTKVTLSIKCGKRRKLYKAVLRKFEPGCTCCYEYLYFDVLPKAPKVPAA